MDPSRLQSESRLRLIAVVVMLSTISFFFVHLLNIGKTADALARCGKEASQAVPIIRSVRDRASWWLAYERCYAPAQRAAALGLIDGGLTFLPVGVGVYLAQARWRLRRRGMRPLDGQMQVQIAAAVESMSRTAGLRRAPQLYFDVRAGAMPSAFGTASEPILAVGQGTLVASTANRPVFDAVMHHELFHLRANDVRTYYRTLAVFRACFGITLVYAVLIVGAIALKGTYKPQALFLAAQFTGMMALGLVTLRHYLRSRESYADMYAVDQTGDRTAMEAALRTAGSGEEPARILGVFRSHPSTAERISALRDRQRALTFSGGAAFLTGATLGAVGPGIMYVVGQMGVRPLTVHNAWFAGVACGLFFGPIFSIGIWRNIHMGLMAGRHWSNRGFVVGLLATGGMLVGGLLPLNVFFDGAGPAIPPVLAPVVLLACGVVSICVWIGACSYLWLRTDPRRLSRRAYKVQMWLATLVAVGIFAAVYDLSSLLRGNRMLNVPSLPGAPQLDPSRRPTDAWVVRRFFDGLSQEWWPYLLVALTVLWLAAALVRGLRARTGSPVNGVPQRAPQISPTSSSVVLPVTPALAATPTGPTATAAGAITPSASLDPPSRPRHVWLVLVLAALAMSLLITAHGLTPTLPLVVVIGGAAMLLAWASYFHGAPPKRLVISMYASAGVVLLATTLPFHNYRPLWVVGSAAIGAAAAATIGLPLPGNRHVFTLLAGGLLLNYSPWALWAVFAMTVLLGVGLQLVPGHKPGDWQRTTSLGFAIAGVIGMALGAGVI